MAAGAPTVNYFTAGTIAGLDARAFGPRSVVIGDFNGDGKPDVAGIGPDELGITVVTRNAANTGWDTPSTAELGSYSHMALAAGDLNGDGKLDFAAAKYGGDSVTVVTRKADGSGWDAATTAGSTGSNPTSIAIGDLDGDGKPDIATANAYPGNSVTVITRKSDGSGWNAPTTAGVTDMNPRCVAIGDLNGDGRPDLVTSNVNDGTSPGSLTVITRKSDGSGWDAPVKISLAQIEPYSVAIGDLNGDGKADLVTANIGSTSVTVIARKSDGSGWATPEEIPGTGLEPWSVAIGDLDGDGQPDIATVDQSGDTVTMIARKSDGSGWNAPHTVASTSRAPQAVAIGDLTGDGLLDIVASGKGSLADPTGIPGYITVFTAGYDNVAPATSDNVSDSAVKDGAVTLTAIDTGGSGVASIRYLKGIAPADPSEPANNPLTYNAASKPVLANGEKIRYSAIDRAGNAETAKTSLAAKILPPATPPSSAFTPSSVLSLAAARVLHGTLSFKATVSDAGTLASKATIRVNGKTLPYASGQSSVVAGVTTVSLKPGAKAKAALAKYAGTRVKLTLTVIFTTTGATPTSKTITLTVKN
jgi:hypothetical protein